MPPPPRRARFQIHLSTAIVLMFVAGGLIWANARVRTETFRHSPEVNPWKEILNKYGWPLTAFWNYEDFDELSNGSEGASPRNPRDNSISYPFAVVDVASALIILFAVCFLCEGLIRRSGARKGA